MIVYEEATKQFSKKDNCLSTIIPYFLNIIGNIKKVEFDDQLLSEHSETLEIVKIISFHYLEKYTDEYYKHD